LRCWQFPWHTHSPHRILLNTQQISTTCLICRHFFPAVSSFLPSALSCHQVYPPSSLSLPSTPLLHRASSSSEHPASSLQATTSCQSSTSQRHYPNSLLPEVHRSAAVKSSLQSIPSRHKSLSLHQVYPPSSLSCRRTSKQERLADLPFLHDTPQIHSAQKYISVLLSSQACSQVHPAINSFHSIRFIRCQAFPAVEPPSKDVFSIFHFSKTPFNFYCSQKPSPLLPPISKQKACQFHILFPRDHPNKNHYTRHS
jgi:hypothetical protein